MKLENPLLEKTKTRRFEDIALPHLDAAYNLARWLTRNNQDAEDVVQEAYLRAFRFFDGFRGNDERAWLMAIVRNTCYTWLERNRPQTLIYSFDENVDSNGDETPTSDHVDNDPASLVSRLDDRRMISAAIEQLPLEFREILILRELEELSYKEIAVIADIPLGTVMSRLARARKAFGDAIRRMDRES